LSFSIWQGVLYQPAWMTGPCRKNPRTRIITSLQLHCPKKTMTNLRRLGLLWQRRNDPLDYAVAPGDVFEISLQEFGESRPKQLVGTEAAPEKAVG
jgi:hypothetical protein